MPTILETQPAADAAKRMKTSHDFFNAFQRVLGSRLRMNLQPVACGSPDAPLHPTPEESGS